MTNTATNTVGVEPGTIVVFSDLVCPFSHIAVHRHLSPASASVSTTGCVLITIPSRSNY